MRAALAVAVAALLLIVAVPAEGEKPFPQTQDALRTLARDTVDDADREAADALRAAHALAKELRRTVRGITLPSIAQGTLEMRLGGAQPVVRGEEDFLALAWIGTKDATPWTGIYWIEMNGEATSPNAITLDAEGGIFFVDAGVRPLPDEVAITYHFLGLDGAQESHSLGVSRVLDFMPIEERADFGLALASASSHEPEALLMSPWNTLASDAALTMSYLDGDDTIAEYRVGDCDDFEATTTSAGCRLLYLDALPPALTALQLSHEGPDGERVIDVTLTLDELLAGYSSAL